MSKKLREIGILSDRDNSMTFRFLTSTVVVDRLVERYTRMFVLLIDVRNCHRRAELINWRFLLIRSLYFQSNDEELKRVTFTVASEIRAASN